MRIVYVSTLPGAGPVTHLRELAPAVAARGHDVRVLCADEDVAASFTRLGVDAIATPLSHKLDVRGLLRLRPDLREAELVHTHDRRAGLLARVLGRALGAASVHTFHGLPHEIAPLVGRPDASLPGVSRTRRAWLLHGNLRIESALARLGLVIVPSHAVAGFLAEHGLPERRLRVVPNGVTVEPAEPAPRREPLAVGTAGVLEQRKGVDVLLEAAARLEAPVRVEVFGDGPLAAELPALAARLGVDARFHGEVPNARERFGELDVFVLASRDENLPMAALEAMAAAVPVVATRVGGVPELLRDGENGLLVEPDRVEELARALDRLAADEELRVRLAREGACTVRERFSTEAMADATVAVYEEALRR
jgi:glycosyltransferase involved in cell wall biosynthesis